jgi:hypothetical protein
MNNFSRALDSYEARFTRGPVDPTLHTCTGCRFEVESVDSHGHCDECSAARDAADEAEAAAAECPACEGTGCVRSSCMSTEADCDLDDCRACGGSGLRGDAELAADEGFTAWTADRQLADAEAMALEFDANDCGAREVA